jgi:uncharacterized protein
MTGKKPITPEKWDWPAIGAELENNGYAVTPTALSAADCATLIDHYGQPRYWRSKVIMARHRFGSGEYQYFANPLPKPVIELRTAVYPRLVPVANAWSERLGFDTRFPADLDEFLARCHDAGQTKPTPLLLRYQTGDYNCLHQDIYGEHAFPLQLMVALSQVDVDYTGGEFMLVENLPRAQSRGRSITLNQGQAVIWPTRYRPGVGQRGNYRIAVRHGVSTVHSGLRHTLGVIFHDAA